MTSPGRAAVDEAITAVAREDSGRILAVLARRFGDLDLADDAVQDALAKAVETWPTGGIPDNPPAWLLTVARNNAVDRLRRAASARRRLLAAAPDLVQSEADSDYETDAGASLTLDDAQIRDDQLRLILLCAHPALDTDSQVALTLRLVGGLTTAEIAAAFLVPEATLAQRIVRAKRKIRAAAIPLAIPSSLNDRVGTLLQVVYLIFNEAYLSRGRVDTLTRVDLADEAIRLTRQIREVLPSNAEVEGLLALELFHRSRLAARQDAAGELVLLEAQDRTGWDRAMIGEANSVLVQAMSRMTPGVFQVQALIASHHVNATQESGPDWSTIAALYAQLAAMTGSAIVGLNHAVSVAMADNPQAGLALLEQLPGLAEYHLYYSARAELLVLLGEFDMACRDFVKARTLTANPTEQRHLDRRIAQVGQV